MALNPADRESISLALSLSLGVLEPAIQLALWYVVSNRESSVGLVEPYVTSFIDFQNDI